MTLLPRIVFFFERGVRIVGRRRAPRPLALAALLRAELLLRLGAVGVRSAAWCQSGRLAWLGMIIQVRCVWLEILVTTMLII